MKLRHLPAVKYSGLTIVLSNPSRYDVPANRLLSGFAGLNFFNDECLQTNFNRYQCDIRTDNTIDLGLLPDTKCILLLGDKATYEWSKGNEGLTLNQLRGNLLQNIINDSIPCIASYLPQDACDMKDYEGKHNPLAKPSIDSANKSSEAGEEKSKKGKTDRSNFRFWLTKDVKKCCNITKNGLPTPVQTKYNIYPNSTDAINFLRNCNERIYLDIENDTELNINTIGFASNHSEVFVLPILRYDYSLPYSLRDLSLIFRELAGAMNRCEIICHNAMHDLVVLAHKYKLPFGKRVYDTMLAQARTFPEVEKSLGHCISLWLYNRYHKEDGIFMPQNKEQEMKLWEYNGKDVSTMVLIREAIDKYASAHEGLTESIAQVNSCIRPYIINSLMGIHYNEEARAEITKENDRKMNQYIRWLRILTGLDEFLPTSNKQCIEYFHELLGYDIVGRSKRTGKPSLDEKNLQKLKLKYRDNPVIDICLAYRREQKETGSLGFTPWMTNII